MAILTRTMRLATLRACKAALQSRSGSGACKIAAMYGLVLRALQT